MTMGTGYEPKTLLEINPQPSIHIFRKSKKLCPSLLEAKGTWYGGHPGWPTHDHLSSCIQPDLIRAPRALGPSGPKRREEPSWTNKWTWISLRLLLGPVSLIPSGIRCLKWASTPALWGTTTSLLPPLLACTQWTIRMSTSSGFTTYLLRTPYFHLFLSRNTCIASLILGILALCGNCLLTSTSLKDHSPGAMVIYEATEDMPVVVFTRNALKKRILWEISQGEGGCISDKKKSS